MVWTRFFGSLWADHVAAVVCVRADRPKCRVSFTPGCSTSISCVLVAAFTTLTRCEFARHCTRLTQIWGSQASFTEPCRERTACAYSQNLFSGNSLCTRSFESLYSSIAPNWHYSFFLSALDARIVLSSMIIHFRDLF